MENKMYNIIKKSENEPFLNIGPPKCIIRYHVMNSFKNVFKNHVKILKVFENATYIKTFKKWTVEMIWNF